MSRVFVLVAIAAAICSVGTEAEGEGHSRYRDIGRIDGSDGPVGGIDMGEAERIVIKPGVADWQLDSEAWFDAGAALLKSATDQNWAVYSLGARCLMVSLRLDPNSQLAAFSHSNIAYAIQRLRGNAGGHWRWKAWSNMASYVRKDGSESAYEALAWVHVQNDDALGAERAYYRGLENLCVPPVREKVQPGGSRQCAASSSFWYKWFDALQLGSNHEMWDHALDEVMMVLEHELGREGGHAPGMTMSQAMRVPLTDSTRRAIAKAHSRAAHARLLALSSSGQHSYPLPSPLSLPPLAGRRARVGYLSFNFSPVRNLNGLASGMFSHARHGTARIDPICFAIYGHHRRDSDEEAAEAQRGCEAWVDLMGESSSDFEIATTINSKKIDILVDLVGLIANNRHGICLYRPAATQVIMIYAATTGGHGGDYMIGDRIATPPDLSPSVLTESIITFPGSMSHFVNNQRGLLPPPPSRGVADSDEGEQLAGVDSQGGGVPSSNSGGGVPLLCAMNAFFKIDPPVLASWLTVLDHVPDAHVLLTKYQYHEAASPRLRREAERRGVSPERIEFLPKTPSLPGHIERLATCLAFLDTRLYNAHTLAVDALWAGVPLVTYPNTAFASRVSSSLLIPSGLGSLIARTWEDYVSIATALARGRGGALRDRARALSAEGGERGMVFDGDAWMCAYGRGIRMAADLKETLTTSEISGGVPGGGRRHQIVVAGGGC